MAICAGRSFTFGSGGIRNSGFIPCTAEMSKLSSGFPGTTAGPESPPIKMASRLSSKRPPRVLLAFTEWQL